MQRSGRPARRTERTGAARANWALVAWLAAVGSASAADFPQFKEVVLDPNVGKVCYAVTLADVDGDGKRDVVAVTENRVLWYQAPDWKKRVVIENQTELDNVCLDPHDVDGDGQIDFALGAGWLNGKNLGTIQWLSRGQTLDDKWSVHLIGAEPWTHRMRWADVLGTGKPQLVVSPLNKSEGRAGVRVTAFSIPANPRTDAWPRTVLDETQDKMHNHWHVDLNGDGTPETLTAGQEGVFSVARAGKDKEFQRTKLPHSQGAGEVKSGRLAKDGRYVAAIEPMHGTHAVVYLRDASAPEATRRIVLTEKLSRGHAIWAIDVDGDGDEELVVGNSDPAKGTLHGPRLSVWDPQENGTKWVEHVIDDGGVAVEDAVAGDLTGDGRPDLVAGGRATHNLKLYVNEGK